MKNLDSKRLKNKDEKSEAEKLAAILRGDTDTLVAKLTKESDEKIERYIGALTEDFQHGLSAVAEQFLGLNEKVDTLGEKVDSLADFTTERFVDLGMKVNTLESKVDVLQSDVSTIINRVDGLDGKFDVLESKVDVLQSDVSIIKHGLRQKVDRSDFLPLESRVTVLEA